MAILLVSLAVMPLQIIFFAQHLAVYQPRGRDESNQADPIREYQKLAEEDHCKRDIDGIAAERKNAVHDELVGMIGVDDDPETTSEGARAPEEKTDACEAEQHSGPCHGLGMEKWTHADIGPTERGGEQDIEIEEDKRRKQEIGLVGAPQLHRFDPFAFQQKDPGQNHSQQENDREASKIFWHRRRLRSRGRGEDDSTLGSHERACPLQGPQGARIVVPLCALSTAAAQRAARKGGIVGKWSSNGLIGSVLVLASVSAVQAAELQIIAGGGIAGPLNEIATLFERASGHKLVIRYGTAPELIKMAASGVPFDLGVVPQDVWKDAAARAQVAPGP